MAVMTGSVGERHVGQDLNAALKTMIYESIGRCPLCQLL
jgi:hypothetical protein